MRIGFDIDGVLSNSHSSLWATFKGKPDIIRLYCSEMRPLLNPHLFAHESDELHIITARTEDLFEITKRWCDKFFPGISLHQVAVKPYESSDFRAFEVWWQQVASAKASIINELKLDVYFEDMARTVLILRKLCPNIKIIQFGGKLLF